MKFYLEIELGNEAMQTPGDVADALQRVQGKLVQGYDAGPIHDVNGNMVGLFELGTEADEERLISETYRTLFG